MAGKHGKNGKLTVGASGVVSKVTNWTRSQKADLVEDGGMGDGDHKSYIVGRDETTYEIQGNYDPADSDGQGVIVAGAALAYKLYPEGETSTKKYYYGDGLIESVGQTGQLDGKITFSATIRVTGVDTYGTVA